MKRILILLVSLLAGAFLFQSFQCSSKNLTTAKVAYSNKDYPKALDYLQKEVQVNPTNAEAYAILADIYKEQEKWDLAAVNAKKALELAKTDDLKNRQTALIQQIWIECYNKGINTFNSYNGTNKEVLDDAVKYFDIGIDLRPHILDFYRFKGMISEIKGDTVKGMEYYSEYVKRMEPEVDLASKKGFYLEMPREKFLQAIGVKPLNTINKMTEAYDTNFVDIFNIDGKELYAFSNANDNGEKVLTYWDFDPSPSIPNDEKTMAFNFSMDSYGALAQYHYAKKDFDKSFNYIDMITKLQPNNTEAQRSKLALYQEMGKTDVALNEAMSLTKTDPNNKSTWAQLGDLQQNMKKFDEAIESYKRALDIDPNYDVVLRNVASAYKNKASIVQRQQQDKADKDKAYQPNAEEYFPLLRESAKYFSQALKTERFGTNYQVLGEIGNIYMVLGQDADLKRIARTLEGIAPLVPADQLESYYLVMLSIYGGTKESNKLNEIQEKMNKK